MCKKNKIEIYVYCRICLFDDKVCRISVIDYKVDYCRICILEDKDDI